MKNSLLLLGYGMLVFMLVIFSGCGVSETSQFDLPMDEEAFYSRAMDTAPVIEADASAQTSLGVTKDVSDRWTSGNPVYEIFNAFQEYRYPRDEGVIDVSNMYKLLFEASHAYTDALFDVARLEGAESCVAEGEGDVSSCETTDDIGTTELVEGTLVKSPFDFGHSTRSYTHASNNAALARSSDTISALLTWIWDESPKLSYGVIEGKFNLSTGDLELDMVYLVDYPTGSDYAVRTFLSGNAITHRFTVKTAKTGTVSGAYSISMIGAGVAKSTNPDDYFLIKVIDNETLASFPSGRYFKIPSSADESLLMTILTTGSELADISDPEGFSTTIEGLTFFALDGSDHALSVSDFSNPALALTF